ncbi:hypothetical protein K7N18_37485 [Burkholderia arboris]|uniref:hypothetical protein n=1 Tax=Burkholderia arboris TaxID=488730 RepID=UPI001CA459A1|nr:hypothetical protein [Burkholderia arboris]MBY8610515.1 hypothetical protein [Burkholderia arboris]
MSKYTPTVQRDAEKIVSVMEPEGRYSATALRIAARISLSRVPPALDYLIDTRRIVCHVTRQRHQYSLHETGGTRKAPQLASRLSTHLTGYDQQIRQFVTLCMLARPPVATVSSRDATDESSASPTVEHNESVTVCEVKMST